MGDRNLKIQAVYVLAIAGIAGFLIGYKLAPTIQSTTAELEGAFLGAGGGLLAALLFL